MEIKKVLIKKTCKACGNKVIVARAEHGNTPAPKNCATCKSLGVEKAIEQRLMCSRKQDKTTYEIKSKILKKIERQKVTAKLSQ